MSNQIAEIKHRYQTLFGGYRNMGLRGDLPKNSEARKNFLKNCKRCPFCFEKSCRKEEHRILNQ